MSAERAVSVRNLSKTFPGQIALDSIDMDIHHGEVHALLGHNGSGKSTFIKLLAGVHTPDPGGSIRIDGNDLEPGSPARSHQVGLRFVHQDLALIDSMSVAENMALTMGYSRTSRRTIDWETLYARCERLLGELDATLPLDTPVGELDAVDRCIIAVARALDGLSGSGMLVLDEPTASLPPDQVERLFDVVRRLRSNGISCLYVTHRMDEISHIADRFTVFRDGVRIITDDVANTTERSLVSLILGTTDVIEENSNDRSAAPTNGDVPALEVSGLCSHRLHDVSLRVGSGEILGVAGLTGSGREELGLALVGGSDGSVSTYRCAGHPVSRLTPKDVRRHGVALVPGSRGPGSLIPSFTVTENLTFASLGSYQRSGWVRRRMESAAVGRWIDRFDVKPRRADATLGELSGGNQQKVLVAKWMNTSPHVLIIDEPTAGVDVGASQMIHRLIIEAARGGLACIVISSDIDDLVATCDRVLVMKHGRVAADLTRERVTKGDITLAMSA